MTLGEVPVWVILAFVGAYFLGQILVYLSIEAYDRLAPIYFDWRRRRRYKKWKRENPEEAAKWEAAYAQAFKGIREAVRAYRNAVLRVGEANRNLEAAKREARREK